MMNDWTMKRFLLFLLVLPLTILSVRCGRIDEEDDGNNDFKPISLTTKQAG